MRNEIENNAFKDIEEIDNGNINWCDEYGLYMTSDGLAWVIKRNLDNGHKNYYSYGYNEDINKTNAQIIFYDEKVFDEEFKDEEIHWFTEQHGNFLDGAYLWFLKKVPGKHVEMWFIGNLEEWPEEDLRQRLKMMPDLDEWADAAESYDIQLKECKGEHEGVNCPHDFGVYIKSN